MQGVKIVVWKFHRLETPACKLLNAESSLSMEIGFIVRGIWEIYYQDQSLVKVCKAFGQ